jgi:hypothetical protein
MRYKVEIFPAGLPTSNVEADSTLRFQVTYALQESPFNNRKVERTDMTDGQ